MVTRVAVAEAKGTFAVLAFWPAPTNRRFGYSFPSESVGLTALHSRRSGRGRRGVVCTLAAPTPEQGLSNATDDGSAPRLGCRMGCGRGHLTTTTAAAAAGVHSGRHDVSVHRPRGSCRSSSSSSGIPGACAGARSTRCDGGLLLLFDYVPVILSIVLKSLSLKEVFEDTSQVPVIFNRD